MASTDVSAEDHAMQCMEIRGGNQAIEEVVVTPGIDAWVYSRPYKGDDSGGDVHYVSLCGGGYITRLIVADVSGHGSTVSQFSAPLRTLMRKNINTKNQTRLVETLNQEFAAFAQWRKFATAVIATYLASDQRLTVCNAGHPRPFWYRAADRTWEVLDRTTGVRGNLPLGIDEHTTYNQFDVALGQNDIVVFYTDALTEAADPSGRLLGEDGLLAAARALDAEDARGVGSGLVAAVEKHREGRPANDDMTIVTFRHNGKPPPRLTIGQKIDVYSKVLGLKTY